MADSVERYWPEEAIDFGVAVEGALARAGRVELARRCETDPSARVRDVRPVLEALGIFELDPYSSTTEAAAAALALHAAGAVVCPWPLVQQLVIPLAAREALDALYLGDGDVARAEHLDLVGTPAALDILTGSLRRLSGDGGVSHMPLDPFGVRSSVGSPLDLELPGAALMFAVLASFWIVGALGSARDLAATHARDRRQFGRSIADFGGIQWHLSDIAVAHDGLWELACHSLAQLTEDRLRPADALAVMFASREAAHEVLGHAHQILAAMGLCEEHDLAVIDRHLQPLLRRPFGMTRALSLLAEEIARSGFESLYLTVAPAETRRPTTPTA